MFIEFEFFSSKIDEMNGVNVELKKRFEEKVAVIEELQLMAEKYSKLGSFYALSVFELCNCIQLAQNCFPSSSQFPKELERLVETAARHKMGDFFKEFEKVSLRNYEKI